MIYTAYHVHTELSLLDSCTNYKLYVDKAKEYGMKALAFSEHGNIYNWLEKKQYCEKNGIKYIHACEVYLTEQLEPKVRDNYHTVLIAKNFQGFLELNSLITLSTSDGHKYYKPRLTFDEFLSISDNIISTSACLASPLNKLPKNNPYYSKLANKYTYYEIQPHDYQEQKDYNKYLLLLSKQFNKPLILGTDTHSLDKYKAECRSILQRGKGIIYTDEDSFDLTFKSYDNLLDMCKKQNCFDVNIYAEAINNTNLMSEQIVEIKLDTSLKYPNLYGNEEEAFITEIRKKYQEKISQNIISKDLIYRQKINEEFKVFKKLGMFSFMLFMSELITWCHENDIPTGFCRGSVGGSTIAYILDIIDLNPVKWNTVFSRFANEDRVSLGDIDCDFAPKDRERVYQYIINRFKEIGDYRTCYILTTNTVSDKGTIDEIGRALSAIWVSNNPQMIQLKNEIDNELNKAKKENDLYGVWSVETFGYQRWQEVNDSENPYSLSNIARIKKEYEENAETTKQKYPRLFYYFEGIKGTVISQGIHPAGIVASTYSLNDNIGLFYYDNKVVSQINMDEIHDLNYVKYDILGLKNIGIIKDTYKLLGSHYLKSHEIDWEEQDVWMDIITSPVGIFQFEGKYAFDLLKKFMPTKINDLSLVNASLRPSGASYRDSLIAHEFHKNPSKEIDELLKDNNGFLVFQEDTIKFLTDICGFSGSHADNVRRAIGQKKEAVLKEELPQIFEGYCNYSNKPRNVAEEEAKEFIQIISDSSDYQFGYNHSTGYSMIGYNCGMLRYKHPLEFITAYLNNAGNEEDITIGTNLAKEKGIIIEHIKFRYSSALYSCDKETNKIYKGMSSIKFLNEKISDELYQLRNNKYDSFIDLLKDIKDKTSCDSRQLEILIKLNFFSEFGYNGKLLKINEYFNLLYGKKQIKKENLEKLRLNKDIVEKHSAKITEKIYKDIDIDRVLYDICEGIPNTSINLAEQLNLEKEVLGYSIYYDPSYSSRVFYVSELEILKSITKIKLYKIKTGQSQDVKMWTSQFNKNEFKKGEFLYLEKVNPKPQQTPTGEVNPETGKKIYRDVEGTVEYWLQKYKNVSYQFEN